MASSSSNNSHVSYSSFSDSFLKANPEMVKELGASEVKKLAGAFFQPSLNGSLDNSESLFSSLKSDILSRLFLELEKAGKSLTKKNQASTRKEYIAKVEGLRNTLDGSEKDYKRYIKEIFDLSISLHCTWPDDPELWKPVFLEEAYEEYSKGGLKLCFLDDLEYLFSFISCVGKIKCVAQVKKIELPAVVSKLEKFIEDSLIRNLNTLSSSQCAAYLGAVNRHLKMAKSTPPYAKLLVAQLSQIAQDKRFPKGQHPLFRNKFPVTVAALILLRKGLSCNEKVLKQFVELAKRMPERSERGSDHTAKTKKQVQLFASNPSKGQLPEQVWPLVREEGIQDWNFGHLRLAWELSHKKMSTAAPQNLQSYLHLACEILSDPRLGR